MIINPFTSAKIRIAAVTLFCKYSLDIADMPLRKTDLKIEKVILPQFTDGIRIPKAKIY
jgi:hypothetical protein